MRNDPRSSLENALCNAIYRINRCVLSDRHFGWPPASEPSSLVGWANRESRQIGCHAREVQAPTTLRWGRSRCGASSFHSLTTHGACRPGLISKPARRSRSDCWIAERGCSYGATRHRKTVAVHGAGDGNRTHVSSLGSYSSTIELRPRGVGRVYAPAGLGRNAWRT